MSGRTPACLLASVCPGEQSQAGLQVTACMLPGGRREQQNLPFGGTVGFGPPAGGPTAVSVILVLLSAQNGDGIETGGDASRAL